MTAIILNVDNTLAKEEVLMVFDWLEVHTKLTLVNLILTKTTFLQNFVVAERLTMLVNSDFLDCVTCHTLCKWTMA